MESSTSLYHLDGTDVFEFIRRIYEVCTRVATIDTHVAIHPDEPFEFEGRTYHGSWFTEHDESADEETKLKNLWASIDNNRSFWPTPASLANFANQAGLTPMPEEMPRLSVESSNPAVRLVTRTLPRPITQGLRRAFRMIKPKPFRTAVAPILKEARSLQPRKSEPSDH